MTDMHAPPRDTFLSAPPATAPHLAAPARDAGTGPGSRSWLPALMAMSFLAPVFGQIAMAGMIVQQGNRWYLGFVIPAAIGSLASCAAMLVQMRDAKRASRPGEEPAAAAASGGSASDRAVAQCMESALPPLEALLFPDVPAAKRLRPQHAWRAVCHAWSRRMPGGDATGPSLPAPIGIGIGIGAQDSHNDSQEGQPDTQQTGIGVHPIVLDIVRQGPHALVAGTTGSGKSVFLESWCLALACLNPSDQLHFVFLDFKGGAAFRVLRTLPHCVGDVSDLSLAHAARALRALEGELRRREELLARHGASTMDELERPCPRLIVVVDEFAALRQRMPDYVDRLVSLASLGRSLGMNLIICTQNPLGQVNADMKANLNLNVCLRVRDSLQSVELIGGPHAAHISPKRPGTAFICDGDGLTLARCSPSSSTRVWVDACRRAAEFCGGEAPAPLFSSPLPRHARLGGSHGSALHRPPADVLAVGLRDDGIRLHEWQLALRGNLAIIGAPGCGKSTALAAIRQGARESGWLVLPARPPWDTRLVRPDGGIALLADDADALLDPLSQSEEAQTFRDCLADRTTHVVFTAKSARHVRYPEDCTQRVVFPTPDKSTNALLGVPAGIAAMLCEEDWRTPGRAVELAEASSLVQWRDDCPL